MPDLTYFTHEAPIVAALAAIDGLEVRTAPDTDEALSLATMKPTAVVVFDADETLQSNRDGMLVHRGVSVHLFFIGATAEREAEDGQVMLRVLWALHGLEMPGYAEPLLCRGSESALTGGVREYHLAFSTKTSLYRPAGY